ncbi:alpha-kinase family-domain-containing protein [Baffinella frigidus]|nr:alpha-kinase family-domain-containing protein [Cryptophyta sp. CCMP2293]
MLGASTAFSHFTWAASKHTVLVTADSCKAADSFWGGLACHGGVAADSLWLAFSHFTWEASKHKVLVCDLQGVGDSWTDPQIHSIDGKGYGKGNMGTRGIKAFLNNHRCNAGNAEEEQPRNNAAPRPDTLTFKP